LRTIRKLVFHCNDSDVRSHANVETLRKWHVDENGWSDIGYQYFIDFDGVVWPCRPVHIAGAHCKGNNHDSIGICLAGRNKFNDKQFEAAIILARELCVQFGLENDQIFGHRHFNKDKTCPNYNIDKVLPF